MLTYNLFKIQSILLSETSRKGQPDVDLHAVQSPEHALFSNKQEGPKQNIYLHSVYNQSTFVLKSSWDQLDVGLLSVEIYHFILWLDTQVSSTYHMWKMIQYILNHLPPLSSSFK